MQRIEQTERTENLRLCFVRDVAEKVLSAQIKNERSQLVIANTAAEIAGKYFLLNQVAGDPATIAMMLANKRTASGESRSTRGYASCLAMTEAPRLYLVLQPHLSGEASGTPFAMEVFGPGLMSPAPV